MSAITTSSSSTATRAEVAEQVTRDNAAQVLRSDQQRRDAVSSLEETQAQFAGSTAVARDAESAVRAAPEAADGPIASVLEDLRARRFAARVAAAKGPGARRFLGQHHRRRAFCMFSDWLRSMWRASHLPARREPRQPLLTAPAETGLYELCVFGEGSKTLVSSPIEIVAADVRSLTLDCGLITTRLAWSTSL